MGRRTRFVAENPASSRNRSMFPVAVAELCPEEEFPMSQGSIESKDQPPTFPRRGEENSRQLRLAPQLEPPDAPSLELPSTSEVSSSQQDPPTVRLPEPDSRSEPVAQDPPTKPPKPPKTAKSPKPDAVSLLPPSPTKHPAETPKTTFLLAEDESPSDHLVPPKKCAQKLTFIHWVCIALVLLLAVTIALLAWFAFRPETSNSSIGGSTFVPPVEDFVPPVGDFVPPVGNESDTIVSGGDEAPTMTTVDTILQRGMVRCGVAPELDGFSMKDSNTGAFTGFEVDLCRAIAAAVLGSGDKLELVTVTPTERFIALQTGQVDVLASHTSQTMERDVFEATAQAGFTFTLPYLYDGLTFGGNPEFVDCADRLDANCTGLRICVVDGTTHAEIIKELLPGVTINKHLSFVDAYDRFVQSSSDPSRGCNVIAGGQFEVAESVVRENSPLFTQSYQVSAGIFSQEPLCLVTRDGDPFWSDMVQWVLQALLADEEREITKQASALTESTPYFGAQFSKIFKNVIDEVGNYADLYERHLSRILPRAEVNMINEGTSGLIFSLPFGSFDAPGPGPIEGGTLKRIKDRGHLRCGVTRFPGFAEFDGVAKEWRGFDIDFCKAVGAAIFDGDSTNVVYSVLTATERFIALADGDVDILSRITTWNLERDVAESTSGTGFDFSQINFYDGIGVGGIPPFAKCADLEDWESAQCRGLRVCVNSGTTTIDIARNLFLDEDVLVEKQSGEAVIQGLTDGDCNAVIGAVLEIVKSSVRALGFQGNYELGSNRFSKDPLAVVTRQDDPQFSAFIKWIVTAIFYAEEEGIDVQMAEAMPTVSLFGPRYGRMLINAVAAVGNYGEIYDRNLQNTVPRVGLNELSVNPLGPRQYPRPGI